MGVSMLRLGSVLLASAILAGCAFDLTQSQPQMAWLRIDGQRGTGNPVLTQQFETDRTICLGKKQQDNEQDEPVDEVAKDCMAKKGYIQVPKDQVEAKQEELAAANIQNKVAATPRRKLLGP